VLMLPFDVETVETGFRMDKLWLGMYIAIAIYVFAFIPYAYFFYESDGDPDEKTSCCCSQWGQAIWYSLCFFIFFAIATVIMWTFIGDAAVQYTGMEQTVQTVFPIKPGGILANNAAPSKGCLQFCVKSTNVWHVDVTLPVYVMALMSFIGWFFFTSFVGVGLVSNPNNPKNPNNPHNPNNPNPNITNNPRYLYPWI
jgi:LMBR1 domain-containing protein 1